MPKKGCSCNPRIGRVVCKKAKGKGFTFTKRKCAKSRVSKRKSEAPIPEVPYV